MDAEQQVHDVVARVLETVDAERATTPKASAAIAALDQLLAGRTGGPGPETSPLASRSHLSTIFSVSEEHDVEGAEQDDGLPELSEARSIAEPALLDFKKASFSSIASTNARQDFVRALDLVHDALAQPPPAAANSTHIVLADPSVFPRKMDSSPDHSPNASPRHGVDGHSREHSNPDSLDSSGFEKLERPSDDVLQQYSQNFAQQMQLNIFGQLPDDPDLSDFVVADYSMRDGATPSSHDARDDEDERDADGVYVLKRIPGDIDDPNAQIMDRPRDDVLEKVYDDDLVDIPRNHPVPTGDLLGEAAAPAHPERHPTPPSDDFADLLAPTHKPEEHQHTTSTDFGLDEPLQQKESPPDMLKHDDELQDYIHEAVEDVHENIDAEMDRYNEEHPVKPPSPSADSGRDTVGRLESDEAAAPHFDRHTPEEAMIERSGPLTIPELPETVPHDIDDLDPFVPPPSAGHHHHGFETEPRPPTPPKDISDEDVKPSVMNLGPAPHHHHHASKQHSILKHSHEPWFDFKTIDPRILDLIYWRDPKKSAIALVLTLVALFVLAKYPILSILTYTSIVVLAGTLGFRIFKAVEAYVKKTPAENPFQPLLESDLSVPSEKVHEQVDVLVEHGQLLATQARRLFLVESILDSVKFALLLWALTYVCSWFSGFGLLIIAVLAIFSIPKFYEVYQEPIDQHLGVLKGHYDNISNQIESKLPFLKRAAAEPEKKDQ